MSYLGKTNEVENTRSYVIKFLSTWASETIIKPDSLCARYTVFLVLKRKVLKILKVKDREQGRLTESLPHTGKIGDRSK